MRCPACRLPGRKRLPKSYTTGVIISRRPAKSTLRRLKHTFQMSSQNGRDRLGVAKGKDKPTKQTKKPKSDKPKGSDSSYQQEKASGRKG